MTGPVDTAAINANQFTWLGNVGVVEASDIGALAVNPWMPSAIRVDSNRTQSSKLFFAAGGRQDGEGEQVSWIYASPDGYRIEILND